LGLISKILEVLCWLFHWKANTTDPDREFQQKHDAWEKELKVLEDAQEQAHQAWKIRVGTGGDATGLLQLHDAWLEAAKAVSNCGGREPRRSVNGTQ
jgi:hypothetical protein